MMHLRARDASLRNLASLGGGDSRRRDSSGDERSSGRDFHSIRKGEERQACQSGSTFDRGRRDASCISTKSNFTSARYTEASMNAYALLTPASSKHAILRPQPSDGIPNSTL